MELFTSIDDILDYVIEQEDESHRFYIHMAEVHAEKGGDFFAEFAAEELKHKARLIAVKENKIRFSEGVEHLNVTFADHDVDCSYDGTGDYVRTLEVAINRETKTLALYNQLASLTQSSELEKALLRLAEGERRHKERLEKILEEHTLKTGCEIKTS